MDNLNAVPNSARPGGLLGQRTPEVRNSDAAFTKLIQERIVRVGKELEIIPQVDRPMTAADILAVFDSVAMYARRGK